MSIDEKRLRDDFKALLRGEPPSPKELANAPLIEDWSPAITGAPNGRQMTLVGVVSGHPTLTDERRIETSPVVWIDRHRRWARTMSRFYLLGKQAGSGGGRAEKT
ncbi:hypothetical protein H8A95_04700 [Bradyrhizobium sp. Pear76]|uniref:DUF6634 family protein n=1 Tax=Bradyrhizobium oropedii TaxID=1571201 RepID=UPI001E50985F|nr:DUF6634 family protein [Bradyrhizobium oropedii]MCC8961637.1 hypothetical protein [Bradyrhizobium oropedii]